MKTLLVISHIILLHISICFIVAEANDLKTGISPQVISLPKGPGSIEGLGESFDPHLNSGIVYYTINLKVQQGRNNFQPALALQYNGGSGNSPFGLGWSIPIKYIQRQTDKGLPQYTDQDSFIDNEGEELIHVGNQVYRNKNENAFIRYHKKDHYWIAYEKSGIQLIFGKSDNGCISNNEKIFRWLLEEAIDTNGNRIHYYYEKFEKGHQAYCSSITYSKNGQYKHDIFFEYEKRPDVFSNYSPTFNLKTEYRCKSISMLTTGQLVRRYVFDYYTNTSVSLLKTCTLIGSDDTSVMPPASFTYSDFTLLNRKLITINDSKDDEFPPLLIMSNEPDLTLNDMNGDSLPDLLFAKAGNHQVYLNLGIGQDGKHRLSDVIHMGQASPDEALSNEGASLADIDGDGRTDFIARRSIDTFFLWRNSESVIWEPVQTFADNSNLSFSFENPSVRLIDINNDKHIDIMYCNDAYGNLYTFFINENGKEFNKLIEKPGIGNGLAFHQHQGMKLADMNGDRLQDIVLIQNGFIIYWPSCGMGEWDKTKIGDWQAGEFGNGTKMKNSPDDEIHQEPGLYYDWKDLILVDLNGDGLSDILYVPVGSDHIVYWLNVSSIEFKGPFKINDLPFRCADTTVIPVDMNGNGSIDILWNYPEDADSQDNWQYLDLFPYEKPYLLKTVSNGTGKKIIFHYSTSTQEYLRDQNNNEWKSKMPYPVPVLSNYEIQDGMGHSYITEITYHDGYHDGAENEFRGFAIVERLDIGDETAPSLITQYTFNTGQTNETLKGKLLELKTQTLDNQIFYKETYLWDIRELTKNPIENQKHVSFPFQTSKVKTIWEKGLGKPVILKWEYEFDNYGNITKLVEHGRTDDDWDDERITESSYSSAYESGQSLWLLNKLIDQKVTDENGKMVSHQILFYDKNDNIGDIQKGNLYKVKKWETGDNYIVTVKNDYDSYGNIIASYDPLFGNQPGHYRQFIYDKYFHTYPIKEIIYTGKNEPEKLILSVTYDYATGNILSSTDFNNATTHYSYDTFGRLTSITKPNDHYSSTLYQYVINHTIDNQKQINWIEIKQRDDSPDDGYLCSRIYYDGLGRKIMTRLEGEKQGQIVVTDVVQYNARQNPWKIFLPYFENNSTLKYHEADKSKKYMEHYYDALSRVIKTNQPDCNNRIVYSKITYEPLIKIVQDEEQTNIRSMHSGCALKYETDGLLDSDGNGRLKHLTEIVKLSDKGEPLNNPVHWITKYNYNLQDLLIGYSDAQNNQKIISYDGLGRKVFMNDPDRGKMNYEYDDASNLIKTTDMKNQTICYEYDGINRIIAEYYKENQLTPDVEYHYDSPAEPLYKGYLFQNKLSEIIANAILYNHEYTIDYDLNKDQQIDISDVVKASKEKIVGTGGLLQAENTKGYLAWVHDQSGEEHRSYDDRGRITWTIKRIYSKSNQQMLNFYTEKQYDSMDRVVKLIYPDNTYIQYLYNNRGLLESIPGIISKYDYNPDGEKALRVMSSGITTSYEYDHRSRLERLHSVRMSDSMSIQDLHYIYDGVSNIVKIEDNRNKNTLEMISKEIGFSNDKAIRFNATQSFKYDSLYRLTQASNPEIFGTINYRYDRIGNMVSKQADLIETDPLMNLGAMLSGGDSGTWNRIGRKSGDSPGPHAFVRAEKLSEGKSIFDYDDNGNMIVEGNKLLTWDSKDRLIHFKNDKYQTTYSYDYANNRKKKIVYDQKANSFNNIYFVNQYSEIRNNQLLKYIYEGKDKILQFQGCIKNNQEDKFIYLNDHIGSTSLVLSYYSNMILKTSYSYPYGYKRTEYKKNNYNKLSYYGFSGKEKDYESGFHYFGSRYYLSWAGNFVSVDPFFGKNIDQSVSISDIYSKYRNNQYLNTTSYSYRRPVVIYDDNGESGAFIGACSGAAIGGTSGAIISIWKGIKNKNIGSREWKAKFAESVTSGAITGAISGAIVGAVVSSTASCGLSAPAEFAVATGAGAIGGTIGNSIGRIVGNKIAGNEWNKNIGQAAVEGLIGGSVAGLLTVGGINIAKPFFSKGGGWMITNVKYKQIQLIKPSSLPKILTTSIPIGSNIASDSIVRKLF